MLAGMTWTFRLRFNLREASTLQSADPEWLIDGGDEKPPVRLTPADHTPSLADARRLALSSSGYGAEGEAAEAGRVWRARLMRAFCCLRISADFGDRAPQSSFTSHGLSMLASGQRELNDVHGLMVFESDPPPIFRYSMLTGTVSQSSPHERLVSAVHCANELGDSQQVAYDLFAESFSQTSPDARFALLMMALEALIDQKHRSAAAQAHVDAMIEATQTSELPQNDISSIRGSLSSLKTESIGQAGRRLAKTLEDSEYNGMKPAMFFDYCYSLRGRLFHGGRPIPTRQEVDTLAGPLEVFVADLLCTS